LGTVQSSEWRAEENGLLKNIYVAAGQLIVDFEDSPTLTEEEYFLLLKDINKQARYGMTSRTDMPELR